MKLLFVGYSTIDIIDGKKYFGGGAGLLSINAKKLGIDSHLLSVLARDEVGNSYINELLKVGVNLSLVSFTAPSMPTCVITHPNQPGSQRQWMGSRVDSFFDDIDITEKHLESFDAIFLANAPLNICHKISNIIGNRKIIYIPGPQSVIQKDYVIEKVFDNAKYVFGNEEESPSIFAKKPFKHGVELTIITKGAQGADIYKSAEERTSFSALPVSTVIDSTGAGDNFALGFTIKILETKNIQKSVDFASKLANLSIQKHGGILDKNVIL